METKRSDVEKSRGSRGPKSDQQGGATNMNDRRRFDQGQQKKENGQNRLDQDQPKPNQDQRRNKQDQGRQEPQNMPRRESDRRRDEPNISGRQENRSNRNEGGAQKSEQSSNNKNQNGGIRSERKENSSGKNVKTEQSAPKFESPNVNVNLNLVMQNMTLNPGHTAPFPVPGGNPSAGQNFHPAGFNPSTPGFNPSAPGLNQNGFNSGMGFNGYNPNGMGRSQPDYRQYNRPPPGMPPGGGSRSNGGPSGRDIPGVESWKVGDQARAKYWEVMYS